MENCIFCNIIKGSIPGHVIYENEEVLVFLDISQTTKGHTLVIPKNHQTDIFHMTEEQMISVFAVVPKIAKGLKAAFGSEGLNLVNNNGAVAGQTVFHYHVHLIPRYAGDGFGIDFPNNMADYDAESLSRLKEKIKVSMGEQ